MSTFARRDAALAARDGRDLHAAPRPSAPLREDLWERPGVAEGRNTALEGLAAPRRRRREDVREGLADRRVARRASVEPERPRQRRSRNAYESVSEPRRTSVSAYMGESTVVGVTPRSARRAASAAGLTLVPPAPERPRRTRPVAEPYGFGEEASWRQEGPSRLPRRERTGERVSRDWLYTGDDQPSRRIPGAARRREAVVDALAAIPRALAAGARGLFQHARGLLVLAFAAFVAFMLYAPARELYVANRRLDTLQATYDALLEENDSIRGDLELLQTREGIENEARARGYVLPGETKVIVEGLPEEDTTSDTAHILKPIELPDNRPWYTRMLDTLFAFDPEE